MTESKHDVARLRDEQATDIAAEALWSIMTGDTRPLWVDMLPRTKRKWREFELARQRLVREITERANAA